MGRSARTVRSYAGTGAPLYSLLILLLLLFSSSSIKELMNEWRPYLRPRKRRKVVTNDKNGELLEA